MKRLLLRREALTDLTSGELESLPGGTLGTGAIGVSGSCLPLRCTHTCLCRWED